MSEANTGPRVYPVGIYIFRDTPLSRYQRIEYKFERTG